MLPRVLDFDSVSSFSSENSTHSSPLRGCVTMPENAIFVILNEVKNLIKSKTYPLEILRLTPQNDITTQPLTGEDRGGGEKNDRYSATYNLPPLLYPLPPGEGKGCPDGHQFTIV
jgi:hypothetical protein